MRPEYTIPVCRAYLASDRAGRTAEYSYLGPVFRSQAGGGERAQTGLESFGRKDAEAADAEIFALAMEAAAEAGAPLAARLGDAGLFDSLLEALALPGVWRRRLRRGVAQGRSLSAVLDGRGGGALAQPGVLAALESADHAGAKALVEDLLAIAGIDAVGGRTAGEIADRFLEQAALRSGEPIDPDKRAILRLLSRRRRRSGRGREPPPTARGRCETRPRQGARRVRKPQRVHRGARRSGRGDRVQRRLRARLRLLHRLRLRGARSLEARREARPGRWPLRRARPASRRRRGHPGRRRRDHDRPAAERERAIDGLRSRKPGGAFRSGRSIQGTPAGGGRGVFRPRRARASAGTRSPRLPRSARPVCRHRGRLSVGDGDRRAARRRRRPFRRHRRGPGARKSPRRRSSPGVARAPWVRARQCGGRGAAGLDRRAHHGRPRGRRLRPYRAARRADAGGDEIRQSDPPLFRRARRSRLSHRRKPGGDRGCAGGRHRGTDRRHRHVRRDAWRPTP